MNCTSLTSVTIPGSVTHIANHAFANTPWLKSLGDFPVVNGILLEYQGSGGNVVIPDSVIKIGDSAFWQCGSLTSVTIPTSVTSIGMVAFRDCSSLTDVYYRGSEEQWKQIYIDMYNESLLSAAIHYNS